MPEIESKQNVMRVVRSMHETDRTTVQSNLNASVANNESRRHFVCEFRRKVLEELVKMKPFAFLAVRQ